MQLSIITINYNNKAGLEKTIASVMAQTWRDFEWILIDGGSTDGSKDVIEELAKNPTANISYWCSEPDGGIYPAMNKGITKANGEYMNFMNSGDCFFDESTLQKIFEREFTADILYGDWIVIDDNTQLTKRVPKNIDLYYFYKMNICHQAMFIKTPILKQNGFDETYLIASDYKRWFDAAISGASFKHVEVVVCKYRSGGLSSIRYDLCCKEATRIKNTCSPAILSVLKKYDVAKHEYLDNPYVIKSKRISDMGGIRLFFFRVMLVIFCGKL